MIIKQIKLKNFRQFKGEHIISFSTDKEKNVSVILGSNTCGKTTIVGAFIWCLYGENILKEPKMLLNNALIKTLSSYSYQDVEVEIIVHHENRDYIILRTQRFQANNNGRDVRANTPELKVSYNDQSGETTPVNKADCSDIIEGILPKALADYFFFDGERIKKINTKGNVVSAVRGLMGLDVYNSGMDHLNPNSSRSVIGVLSSELDTGKDIEAERRKRNIVQYKNDREQYENHQPKLEEEIAYYKDRKEELAQIIRDNKDVGRQQDEKEKIERDIKHTQDQIKRDEETFLNDFNTNACYFFALPLIDNTMNLISSAKKEGEGIPNMHSSSIEYIIKRKKCICGCDLSKNQGALEHLRYEQSLLPPAEIGTILRTFKNEMEAAKQNADSYQNKVGKDYMSWLNNQEFLETKKNEWKEISEKIQGAQDVRKVERDYQEVCNQLEKFEKALIGNRDQMVRLSTLIEDNEREINKLLATNEKNKKINKYIAYAKAIYKWFKEYYDKQEIEVKNELLKSINYNFSQMYHGSRSIIMDDNYKITPVLTDDESSVLSKSEGLETVTNFSFIMGLVELARKKANSAEENNNEFEKVTEPYPIVMDAPFSNTDTTHIENITERLPKVAEQVIIFIMDKDWDIAKKKLNDYVGSKYIIEKVDNKDDYSVLRREI